ALGDELGAAVKAPHLRAHPSAEVALERPRVLLVARGGDVEEREEKRDLARLGAEDRARRDGDEAAEALVGAVARVRLGPVLERLTIPLGSARRVPRRVDRHLGGEVVELG